MAAAKTPKPEVAPAAKPAKPKRPRRPPKTPKRRPPSGREAKFRAHYLATGAIAHSAREAGVTADQGRLMARRANADALFLEQRQALMDDVLPDAMRIVRAAVDIAYERLSSEPPTPAELAQVAQDFGLKAVNYADPRPSYFRGLASALSALTAYRKQERETGAPARPTEVVIRLGGPEVMDPADDGSV